MTSDPFDPIEIAAQLGGTTNPTVAEVASSEAFSPGAAVTDAEVDEAELLGEGELSADVPGPDVDGEPAVDSP